MLEWPPEIFAKRLKLRGLKTMVRWLSIHWKLARAVAILGICSLIVLLLYHQPSTKLFNKIVSSKVMRDAGPASSSPGQVKDWQLEPLASFIQPLYHRINNLMMPDESGEYYIVKDFLSSARAVAPNSSDITLTSYCTSNHLHYVVGISERWRGPISVAVFTYDTDFLYTLKVMLYYIYCYQAQVTRVTFHLIFPKRNYPENLAELKDKVTSRFRCSEPPVSSREGTLNFAFEGGIQFPINLARNVAITSATTRWIFPVDIDFLPSIELHQSFKRLVGSNDTFRNSSVNKLVFIIPAFEVQSGKPVPKDKADLLLAWKRGDVRQYHYSDARIAQTSTNYGQWKKLKITDTLQALYGANYARFYEPFFLAQFPLPLFDERFRQFGLDRISQVCEMYVAGFKFLVLNNAFVVHDGFKGNGYSKRHATVNAELFKNTKFYEKFLDDLKQKYPYSSRRCNKS